jgi:hypothetical protein
MVFRLIVVIVVAATIGLAYLLAKLLLSAIMRRVLPLPSGFAVICSSHGCCNSATIGLEHVVQALNRRGEYRFISGKKAEVYCEKHRPSFANDHPTLQFFVAAGVWICLVSLVSSLAQL